MEAPRIDPALAGPMRVDWESFYANYRKPGYVAGFEIQHKLGGGMFGLVYKARKESIGKDYAIKFLKVDDESVRDAVAREIGTVKFFAQIDHPNLVSIEDQGVVDGIPYLIMSYAGESTLQRRLAAGRLSRDEALRIFVQAARGVQALHEHSLVHFDLKPANIFLKGEVARVGDYGLSKLVSASRNSLSFGRGTPYYMAPELLQRRGDARSDIYSLGIVLYECLYGEVPFRGDSEWEVLRKHEHAAPEFPADSLPQDRAIIARCLQKQPEQRYAAVAELLRELQAPAGLGDSIVLPLPASAPLPAAALPSVAPAAPPEVPPAVPPTVPPAVPLAVPPPWPAGDPAASPFAMPWEPLPPPRGILGYFVRGIFRICEFAVGLVLLPVRVLAAVFGGGIGYLLRLPFRLLGLAAQLVGLLVLAAVIVLLVVTAMHLLAPG